jgi:hypothetical protein
LLACFTRTNSPQKFIGIDAGIVTVVPFKSYRIPPYLLGTGDGHLSGSNCAGDHLERIVHSGVIHLATNGARALFA